MSSHKEDNSVLNLARYLFSPCAPWNKQQLPCCLMWPHSRMRNFRNFRKVLSPTHKIWIAHTQNRVLNENRDRVSKKYFWAPQERHQDWESWAAKHSQTQSHTHWLHIHTHTHTHIGFTTVQQLQSKKSTHCGRIWYSFAIGKIINNQHHETTKSLLFLLLFSCTQACFYRTPCKLCTLNSNAIVIRATKPCHTNNQNMFPWLTNKKPNKETNLVHGAGGAGGAGGGYSK